MNNVKVHVFILWSCVCAVQLHLLVDGDKSKIFCYKMTSPSMNVLKHPSLFFLHIFMLKLLNILCIFALICSFDCFFSSPLVCSLLNKWPAQKPPCLCVLLSPDAFGSHNWNFGSELLQTLLHPIWDWEALSHVDNDCLIIQLEKGSRWIRRCRMIIKAHWFFFVLLQGSVIKSENGALVKYWVFFWRSP